MTAPDIVFGPPAVVGDWSCPDCGAGPRQLCHHWCPRYAEDPGPPPQPDYGHDEEAADAV
jgi:hypothetical protein